jgi:hypothetical protein
LEAAVRHLDMRGNINTKSKQLCAYADDIVIVSRTNKSLEETYAELNQEVEALGLIINQNKTKYTKCTRNKEKLDNTIKIGEHEIERVQEFKYLGTQVNAQNIMKKEIHSRIKHGNIVFYANNSLLGNKLLTRKAKIKLYKSVILPVVTHGCETWTMNEVEEEKLRIFERKVLRKIFGSIQRENGVWTIRTNEEVYNLYGKEDIIKFIKSQRLRWWGHTHWMEDERNFKTLTQWKPPATRPIGRPRTRWQDDVLKDIKTMKIRSWTQLVKDRKKWSEIVEQAKTHTVL